MSAYIRQTRSPLEAVTLKGEAVPSSLSAAYADMATYLASEPQRWRAWKLGATNHGSRAAFGVSRLYFGAIDAEEILNQPQTAPNYRLYELKGEVEVSLRLNADANGFDAWCISLEMPSSPIVNLLEVGVCALVADRCAAGALLLGPVTEGNILPDLSAAQFTLEIDGEAGSVGTYADLVGTPETILDDFMILAKEVGVAPKAGDWIATGGITKCLNFKVGQRVRVLLDGVAHLDFIAQMDV